MDKADSFLYFSDKKKKQWIHEELTGQRDLGLGYFIKEESEQNLGLGHKLKK